MLILLKFELDYFSYSGEENFSQKLDFWCGVEGETEGYYFIFGSIFTQF